MAEWMLLIFRICIYISWARLKLCCSVPPARTVPEKATTAFAQILSITSLSLPPVAVVNKQASSFQLFTRFIYIRHCLLLSKSLSIRFTLIVPYLPGPLNSHSAADFVTNVLLCFLLTFTAGVFFFRQIHYFLCLLNIDILLVFSISTFCLLNIDIFFVFPISIFSLSSQYRDFISLLNIDILFVFLISTFICLLNIDILSVFLISIFSLFSQYRYFLCLLNIDTLLSSQYRYFICLHNIDILFVFLISIFYLSSQSRHFVFLISLFCLLNIDILFLFNIDILLSSQFRYFLCLLDIDILFVFLISTFCLLNFDILFVFSISTFYCLLNIDIFFVFSISRFY